MRTNEPTEQQPWKPLGEKVTAPAPKPAPEWKPKPGSPGVEIGPNDRLRTTDKKA